MAKSKIAIIGLGLIGGSIGLALKQSKLEIEIVGHDKDFGIAGRAQKRGAVDKTDWNLVSACQDASLVVLAIPLDGIKPTLDALKPYLSPGAIITDTATTKVPVMEWAKELPQGVHFIGGDPALSPRKTIEGHGIDNADAGLLQEASYCLTPSVSADPAAIQVVSNFVALLGAKPYFIDAAEHDGLMTGVAHLPALLATGLGAATMRSQGWRELGKLAGANFRTATELLPPNGKTAREQFVAHRADLVHWIDVMQQNLRDLRDLLQAEDTSDLETLIENLNKERDRWLSGNLEETGPAVNWQEATQSSLSRLFLGGLADRGRKTR